MKKTNNRRFVKAVASALGKLHGQAGGLKAYEALSEEARRAFHSAGGKASAAKLTPRQRSLRAKRAAAAREAKKKLKRRKGKAADAA